MNKVLLYVKDIGKNVKLGYALERLGFEVEMIESDEEHIYDVDNKKLFSLEDLKLSGLLQKYNKKGKSIFMHEWYSPHPLLANSICSIDGRLSIPREVDVVIAGGRLNCYPIYCEIVDWNGECYNTSNRKIVQNEELIVRGFLCCRN